MNTDESNTSTDTTTGAANCGRWHNAFLREPMPTVVYRCDRCGETVRSFGERRQLVHDPHGAGGRHPTCAGHLIEVRREAAMSVRR